MPEPEAPEGPKSSKSFFTQKVAGAPLVVWVAVLAVGVGAFMWWRNRQTAAAGASTATSAAGATPTAATSEELMAAGLYQPPAITYNLGTPGAESPTADASAVQPVTTPSPVSGIGPLPAVPLPGYTAPPTPATPVARPPIAKIAPAMPTPVIPKYISVTPWPTLTSTLSGISRKTGVPLATIEKLNPNIKNPNLIYAGESVRYA